MYRDKDRYGQDPTTVMRSKAKFKEPLKWKEPKLIFTCSWSDWFIEDADEWRDEAWEIIKNTPQHTYQILTKRPERIADHLPEDWGEGYPNVWLGVSVEYTKYVPRILKLIGIPAKVRFVSFEPLLGPIDLDYPKGINDVQLVESDSPFSSNEYPANPPITYHMAHFIHWAIIGGESGNDTGKYRYRPCKKEWIEWLLRDLKEAKIPTFVKQLGTHLAKEQGCKDRHGGNMEEWPDWLQVREMPEIFEQKPNA